MNNTKKEKLKKILLGISSPEEIKELMLLNNSEIDDKLDIIKTKLETDLNKVVDDLNGKASTIAETYKAVEKTKKLITGFNEQLTELYGEMSKGMMNKLDEVKSAVSGLSDGGQSVPLYKAMIEGIAGVKKSIEDKPSPSWRWPQYASISVRDKNFSNINPATSDNQDILSSYKISDSDESQATYNYYGFVNADGSWYIQQNKQDNTSYRYYAGTSNYTTNWNNRTSLPYNYYYVIF